MRNLIIGLLGLVLLFSGGGCCHFTAAHAPAAFALPGGTLQVQDTLYFGTSRKDGTHVTAQEWQTFVDDVITPRFPDGLTIFDAAGHWRESDGKLVREATKILLIVHSTVPDCTPKVDEIITEYKRRFQQESVLLVRQPVSARF